MREHKFRAWDKILNCYSRCSWAEISYSPQGECSLLNVGRYIVEQYTGLKDRKRTPEYPEGQEIYEGDIVKLDTPEADVFKTRNRAIIFNPTFAQFCVDPCTSIAHWPSVEVIGTLHENPELQEAQP